MVQHHVSRLWPHGRRLSQYHIMHNFSVVMKGPLGPQYEHRRGTYISVRNGTTYSIHVRVRISYVLVAGSGCQADFLSDPRLAARRRARCGGCTIQHLMYPQVNLVVPLDGNGGQANAYRNTAR